MNIFKITTSLVEVILSRLGSREPVTSVEESTFCSFKNHVLLFYSGAQALTRYEISMALISFYTRYRDVSGESVPHVYKKNKKYLLRRCC